MNYSIAMNGNEFLGAVPSDADIAAMLKEAGVQYTSIITDCILANAEQEGFAVLHDAHAQRVPGQAGFVLIEGADGNTYRFVLKSI